MQRRLTLAFSLLLGIALPTWALEPTGSSTPGPEATPKRNPGKTTGSKSKVRPEKNSDKATDSSSLTPPVSPAETSVVWGAGLSNAGNSLPFDVPNATATTLPTPEPVKAEPVATPPAFPYEVTVVKSYSLPVIWEGREVGRRAIASGSKLLVLSRDGATLNCSLGSQKLQVPAINTDIDTPAPVVAIAQKPVETPAPTPLVAVPESRVEAPVLVKNEVLPAEVAPVPMVDTTDLPMSAEWKSVRDYAAMTMRNISDTPISKRFFQYGKMGLHGPGGFRKSAFEPAASDWKAEKEAQNDLQKAVLQYDHADWQGFERSIASLHQRMIAGTTTVTP